MLTNCMTSRRWVRSFLEMLMNENCQLSVASFPIHLPTRLEAIKHNQLFNSARDFGATENKKKQQLASYNSIKNSTFYSVIKLNGSDGEVFTT